MKVTKCILIACMFPIFTCPASDIQWWLTRGAQSALLQQQKQDLVFATNESSGTVIHVDTTRKFQSIDGFGFALTGSSAYLINRMDAGARKALLGELFGPNGIGISTLRISIGASDLSPSIYFYDDIPAGQTDMLLAQFSLGPDKTLLIPLLREIMKIAPKIKIIATPWSAPLWMKDNGNSVGGSLKDNCYDVYAQYFVRYITEMQEAGIVIDAITPQNEPLNPKNNPSMSMTAQQQLTLLRKLIPELKRAGLKTKVIIYDHNCDNTQYARNILADESVGKRVAGTAFHLYAGDINAMGALHNDFPDRNLYFTEQYTDMKGDFGGDLRWHLKNVVTGAMRNWSRNIIEWNLANDAAYGPHTAGGCSTCKGALTINGSSVKRNVSYYIIAHASKFVPADSKRVWSENKDNLHTTAFVTPAGKTVLIVLNDANSDATFSISVAGKAAKATLPAGSVATYQW